MEKKKASPRQKLFMLAFSSFLVVSMLGVCEAYCRLFTRINFLDNSRGLFTGGRFSNSHGNTPNFSGVSFGETVHIDGNGFRFDPDQTGRSDDAPAILVMGDSVAFGSGLKSHETVPEILRRSVTGGKVYNGSTIGYDTYDYRNAITKITDEIPDIKHVILIFCLNDVSDASAQLIRSRSVQEPWKESGAESFPQRLNNFLRSRSKLYLWLKNSLVDTQLVYFRHDLANYRKGAENVNSALQPIVDIEQNLREKGIGFSVILSPYEAQLRPDSPPEFLEPQKMISAFFADNGIEHYDSTPAFIELSARSMDLFLYGDPMHVSPEGARLLADTACSQIPGCSLKP